MKAKKWLTQGAIGIGLSAIIVAAMVHTRNKAYYDGFGQGVHVALDTVNKIIIHQYESDTSITKLVLIHPDTNTYYLSRKTVVDKK